MKTEESYKNEKYIYNPKPEIDDFWSDCIVPKEKKQPIINNNLNNNNKPNKKSNLIKNNRYKYSQYQPFQNRNENCQYTKKSNIRTYNSIKLFNPKNKINNNSNSSTNSLSINKKLNNSMVKFLENRYPSYIEEKKEEENKKIKSKNALIRCLGLYAYGLELQKTMKMNKENNDKQKIKNDMSKCTFKPKLNKKISYLDDKIYYTRGINRLYNPKKFLNKSLDNIHNNNNNNNNKNDNVANECTFKPRFESNPKSMERMFNNKGKQNNSLDEEKNAKFILRYTKARDENLIKRFKKMYRKDENYDKSLLSLTKRLCNKEYRNYLNVNNTIHLFGETITPNNNLNNLNSSIGNFKGYSYYNDKTDEKKPKKDNYIEKLRRNLLSLDLNENVEE